MYEFFLKRYLDIILSINLIIILSPLLIIVSIAILIFNGKPIFFFSNRIGVKKKTFVMVKFRSMNRNTPLIPSSHMDDDNFTKIGKFIRRTNIDELPQLYNILIGDMSFIGPRPCIISQTNLIHLRDENKIFNYRPGLTGLAQISAYDGMTDAEKCHFDSLYIQKISFVTDLKIIFKTFLYIFRKQPKY